MEVYCVVVDSHGEEDHQFVADLPALPRTGDWIQLSLPGGGERNRSDFIVGIVRFELRENMGDEQPAFTGISIELKFAESDRSSLDHIAAIEANGGAINIPATMF